MSNQATPAVRTPEQVPSRPAAPGVTIREMLGDAEGCRGLHQRRLSLADGSVITGTAGGQGEAWYVIRGSGTLAVQGHGTAALEPGTAVWMRAALGYECRAGAELEVVAVAVQAGSGASGPGLRVVMLGDCEPERTGDREFRVLLSEGLAFTQFAGAIPPGRAPEHHHTYDEVVHVLAGRGVVHLGEATAEIGPGASIYLPPYQPHCLENTGQDLLAVLGVFYPAGSPAAKHEA